MTAEIAILSRSAVALAADSAVTITRFTGPGQREKRVLKGANKVFALSRKHPVAVMIFGDASFMNVPWETVIKMYRSERADVRFETLAEYPKDFFAYLEGNHDLFSPDTQRDAAVTEIRGYAYMLLQQAIDRAREDRNDPPLIQRYVDRRRHLSP